MMILMIRHSASKPRTLSTEKIHSTNLGRFLPPPPILKSQSQKGVFQKQVLYHKIETWYQVV